MALKHDTLIRAALDGKDIQRKSVTGDGAWSTYHDTVGAVSALVVHNDTATEFRIKPEIHVTVLYHNLYKGGHVGTGYPSERQCATARYNAQGIPNVWVFAGLLKQTLEDGIPVKVEFFPDGGK